MRVSVCACVRIHVCVCVHSTVAQKGCPLRYGVAMISRLLKIMGLFCRISSLMALLQKRPIVVRSLLIEATPYHGISTVEGLLLQLSLFVF